MRLSIIIPVLNSHEIVKRQVLYFSKIGIPVDTEIILVDDGSEPPLKKVINEGMVEIIETNDSRKWTQPRARNIGARYAKGEYFLFTDIDHIVTGEAIKFGRNMKYDYARFRREIAVLDESGNVTQDREILMEYGISEERGLKVSCHTLSMIVRATVFWDIGGFKENLFNYPTHDDGNMKKSLKLLEKDKVIIKCPDKNPDERPLIYVIPNGRFCGERNSNPFNFFHTLERP